jgi:hypothetical protein
VERHATHARAVIVIFTAATWVMLSYCAIVAPPPDFQPPFKYTAIVWRGIFVSELLMPFWGALTASVFASMIVDFRTRAIVGFGTRTQLTAASLISVATVWLAFGYDQSLWVKLWFYPVLVVGAGRRNTSGARKARTKGP